MESKFIKINLHSITDIITNSSSEVFISSTSSTVKHVGMLLRQILNSNGSDLNVSDIANIYSISDLLYIEKDGSIKHDCIEDIVYDYRDDVERSLHDYIENIYSLSDAELVNKLTKLDKSIIFNNFYVEDRGADLYIECLNKDYYYIIDILNNLQATFSREVHYN